MCVHVSVPVREWAHTEFLREVSPATNRMKLGERGEADGEYVQILVLNIKECISSTCSGVSAPLCLEANVSISPVGFSLQVNRWPFVSGAESLIV